MGRGFESPMLHCLKQPRSKTLVIFLKQYRFADMAELADAPDLGSGVHDVQVQVLLSAVRNGRRCLNTTFSTIFFHFLFIL